MTWSQLCTILWLRWRLTRNQAARLGTVAAMISVIVTTVLVAVGVGGGLAGFLAGAFGRVGASPLSMLGLWDASAGAFLLFWLIGVLAEIQRAEAIDIGKVLYMPVSLRGIFVVNYVASHLTLSIIVFVPWMMGLAAGFVWGRGGMMVFLLPLVLGFLFSITAWTYWLRGWLVAMLVRNPRRYRAIVGGITMVFILLSQLPNVLAHTHVNSQPGSHGRSGPAASPSPWLTEKDAATGVPLVLLWGHRVIPPLWVGHGALYLTLDNPFPTLGATAGFFAIGGLGLAGAYRSTRRFYQGQGTVPRAQRKRPETKTPAAARIFLEWNLPGLGPATAALTLATLRSFMRATEVKMALASTVPMVLIFAGMMFFSSKPTPTDGTQLLYATGIALLPFLGLMQILNNQFGFDRSGFRILVLSPVPRGQILLGKNLALLPLALGLGLIYMVLAAALRRASWLILLAAVVQLLSAFLLLSLYGSYLSISAPMRVAAGSLKPTKTSTARTLFLMLSFFLLPVVACPLLLPAILAYVLSASGGPWAAPMMLLFSGVELALLAAFYPVGLRRLGARLQRREKDILQIVTQEVE